MKRIHFTIKDKLGVTLNINQAFCFGIAWGRMDEDAYALSITIACFLCTLDWYDKKESIADLPTLAPSNEDKRVMYTARIEQLKVNRMNIDKEVDKFLLQLQAIKLEDA